MSGSRRASLRHSALHPSSPSRSRRDFGAHQIFIAEARGITQSQPDEVCRLVDEDPRELPGLQFKAMRRSRRNDPACTGPRRSRKPGKHIDAHRSAAQRRHSRQHYTNARVLCEEQLRGHYAQRTAPEARKLAADKRRGSQIRKARASAFIGVHRRPTCSSAPLEIQPQRQLNLALRAQTYVLADRRICKHRRPHPRWTPNKADRVEADSTLSEPGSQYGRRSREIRMVE